MYQRQMFKTCLQIGKWKQRNITNTMLDHTSDTLGSIIGRNFIHSVSFFIAYNHDIEPGDILILTYNLFPSTNAFI